MGILNVTPNSFSDGNAQYLNIEKNVEKVKKMIKSGANIIDIGAESTKPGSDTVGTEEQIHRIIPLLKYLKKNNICKKVSLSVDTSDPVVMEESIKYGVRIINDVRALSTNEAIKVVKKNESYVCIAHIKGNPKYMQKNPFYQDLLPEIYNYFFFKIKYLISCGIKKEKIIIDPGIGFGKKARNNIEILNSLQILKKLDCPLLIGISRKSIIGEILGKQVNQRLYGTIGSEILACLNGANIIRTHDVQASFEAIKMVYGVKKHAYF